MDIQLDRIRQKITDLKNTDSNYQIHGASSHQYLLNPTINITEIRQFEDKHKIKLPNAYVRFITEIGNGIAGPYFGLEPFKNCLFEDLDSENLKYLHNPSLPFPHTEEWNQDFNPSVLEDENEKQFFKEYTAFETEYFNSKHSNGVIALSNFGCGVSIYVVVNGTEYGNIWMDDRGSDYGIYPTNDFGITDRITFLDWYEHWLDNSLQSIS